jgi:hypothetical protein
MTAPALYNEIRPPVEAAPRRLAPGLKTTSLLVVPVLNNLSPEILAEQIADIEDLASSPPGPEPRVAIRSTIPDNATAHSRETLIQMAETMIQNAMAAFDRQSPDVDPRERAAMEARFRAAFNEKPERGHNRRRAID